MARYIKTIDGVVTYYNGKYITENGTTIFNPSHEQLIENGWEVYDPQPTEAELFAAAKQAKLQEIAEYDASDNVNKFFIGGQQMWLDASIRSILRLSVQAYQGVGETSVTKVYNGAEYTFTVDQWLYMLNAVEVYASECMNATQRHIAAVNALTTTAEVEDYDYTTGYPTPLTFGE